MRPSLITATSWAMVRMSARLWVTKSMETPSSAWSLASSSMIAACTETSSQEVTSSQIEHRGLGREGAGDGHALALAA